MRCKICQSASNILFRGTILNRHEVEYFKCTNCGFIQTQEPFWLEEAYSNAIADTDTGYVTRNLMYGEIVHTLIKIAFDRSKNFLDYGGGYGLFVRLMRDKGLNFFRQDLYCENIFARSFDISSMDLNGKFELLTAFEVFEHLNNPLGELEKMFGYADSILFSTELQPNEKIKSIGEWWYFAPHMGQHISLFTLKSLQIIAQKYNCNLYSNNRNLHLLTNKKFLINPVKTISIGHNLLDRILSRHFHKKRNLISHDSELARSSVSP